MNNTSWRINWRKSVATHDAGLIAYFDPEKTTSGALRCLGPFVNGTICKRRVSRLVFELSTYFREYRDDTYVLWGSYEVTPLYHEHRFPIIGQECGFSPSLSLGAREFPDLWMDDWTIDDSLAKHRSGLIIGGETGNLDTKVFHPSSFQAEVEICRRYLSKLFDWDVPLPTIAKLPTWCLIGSIDTLQVKTAS